MECAGNRSSKTLRISRDNDCCTKQHSNNRGFARALELCRTRSLAVRTLLLQYSLFFLLPCRIRLQGQKASLFEVQFLFSFVENRRDKAENNNLLSLKKQQRVLQCFPKQKYATRES